MSVVLFAPVVASGGPGPASALGAARALSDR
jgi:hypothetical protein